jgi:hypothetical protein
MSRDDLLERPLIPPLQEPPHQFLIGALPIEVLRVIADGFARHCMYQAHFVDSLWVR